MADPTPATLPGLDPEPIADCVHCGLCLETCPTYAETGREEESPRGRLYLARGLAAGRWEADATLLSHLDHCLGCRACETVCPSGVAYGSILESARAVTRGTRKKPRSRFETFLVRHVLWRGSLLDRLVTAGYRWTRFWVLAHGAASLGVLPGTWRTRLRLVPEPEPGRTVTSTSDGPSIVLLRGCVARALFSETEAAMVALLDRAGYSVEVLGRPECCGALAAHAGERELAVGLGRKLLAALDQGEASVVPTASGCGAHLKGFSHLFHDTLDDDAAKRVESRVLDLTEALARAPRALAFQRDPIPVVYQDACHLRHGQGITGEPRDLLRAAGAELREAEESDLCCGSAGTYNIGEAVMAERLGRRKADVLRRTGARVVVTANPGCAIQLRAHLHRRGDPEVQTLPRFLADRLASDVEAEQD